MSSNDSIYVAGAGGMVGSAVVRELQRSGRNDLLTPTSADLDLTDQAATKNFFDSARPAVVILAAAKVGGILANDTYRADFIYQNLMIEANVVQAAFDAGVSKLILLGSSCIYPKEAPQPMREEYLLTGPLEPTNEPYAIAKIAGIKLCESFYKQHGANFFALMPTNLYGPNDNFDLATSHVIPALIRKFSNAKDDSADTVPIWGTGRPRREFMHVDDLARAILFSIEKIEAADVYEQGISHLNVGTGSDIEIGELAELIARIVGFDGEVTFDVTKPDGTMQKLLDVSRMGGLGWSHTIDLEDGLRQVWDWYRSSSTGAEAGLRH